MNEFKFIDIPLYIKKNNSVQRQIGSLQHNSTLFHDIFIKKIIFTISITIGSFNFYQKHTQVIIMLLLLLNINF